LQPLLVAIDCGHEALAIFLVGQGANPNVADPNGLTPLHYALRKGISVLRTVGHDAQNDVAPLGVSDYLLRPNMPGLVKALLEHGANPNARITVDLARIGDRLQLGLAGATPFLLAAATGDVGIMRALLAKGADAKLATNDRTTPLMAAAGVGRREDRTKEEERQALEAVKLLVELGADVNAANRDMGLTAMHGAANAGSSEIIRFLVDSGAKLDPTDKFGQTPLSIAEGDPNGLSADYNYNTQLIFTPQVHKDAANLLRKLTGVNTQGSGPASASAN
jgi:ankyrin repeat protein